MRTLPCLCALILVGCEPIVHDELNEALLSVRQGTGPDDVWAFGSDLGDGPAMHHWDGDEWSQIDTADIAGNDLWWGFPTASQVFLAGSNGLVGRYDRADGTFEIAEGVDPALTFFGIWGPSDRDVWAVGGGIGTSLPPAVHRWNGTQWMPWAPPTGPGDDGNVYFKVHGTGPDDIWIVGNRGQALRWDGDALQDTGAADVMGDGSGNAPSLLTVDAGGDTPIAVGGAGEGVILHWNDSDGTWTPNNPEFAPALLGVCSGPDGALRAVGGQGSVYAWDGGSWQQWERGITHLGLHACLFDDDGGFWTGGGSIAAAPLDDGVLIYEGPTRLPAP